ncbi:hypothetical protein NAT51_14060 [Flavobacterium amniphilum]|uniref:hypothetical protein n=1 Tax=Flavobacterium amniphilum TaxID=1834035 RepID=UPI00202A77FA|nr:hypothetical protein [Flavobacterium amniphilum]MCL9806656.1 hypothetical protein [Flavobacterium amniphilum]
MYKNLLIIIILFSTINVGFSQISNQGNKSILIYSDDRGYMQPYIENIIRNLVNTETENLYFNSVNSFNRFITDNKYQAELNDLILIHKPINSKSSLYYNESESQVRERIYNILKKYDYFLTVKTNTLGELIEFQFQLFETITSEQNTPYNISDRVLNIENFFINPKEKNYTLEIKNAIQRLFPNTNRIPEVELKLLENTFDGSEDEYFITLPLNTTIDFDGSNSGDYDTENIAYLWRNVINKDEKYQTISKIPLEENSSKQVININKKGRYKLGFKVYDGIQYSREIIINIDTKDKPKELILFDSIATTTIFETLIPIKPKKSLIGKIYFENLELKDSISKNLILSKQSIDQKFINNVDESSIVKSFKVNKQDYQNYSFFEFETTLPNAQKTDNKIYFLYTKDKDGFLNNEKQIKHKILSRSFLNLSLKFSSDVIDFKDDEHEGGYSSFYTSLSFGLLLTENFELDFSIPLSNSNSVIYNGYKFNYPNRFNFSINYLTKPVSMAKDGELNPIILCEFKSYTLEPVTNENEIIYAFSVGPGFGAEYKISSSRLFDFNTRLYLNYSFFSSNTFDKVNSSEICIATVFRF